MCIYTCSSQYREAGREKGIKDWAAVNATCQRNFFHVVGSSAMLHNIVMFVSHRGLLLITWRSMRQLQELTLKFHL